MTRRGLLFLPAAAPLQPPVIVPVHYLPDGRAKLNRDQTLLWQRIWAEAVRDFNAAGVHLKSVLKTGDIRRLASGQPDFTGLQTSVVNLVVTDRIPMEWDKARGLSGVTTLYRGYHLCVVALNHAHTHQIPFLSVNTCVHELLHALLHDIFRSRPGGFSGQSRELQVDAFATRLWLFKDGATIRQSAETYMERLRSEVSGALQ